MRTRRETLTYQQWMGPDVEVFMAEGGTLKEWSMDHDLPYSTVLTWVKVDPQFRWHRDSGQAVYNGNFPPSRPEDKGGHFSNNASTKAILKRISESSTPLHMREWVSNYRGSLGNERVKEAFKAALKRSKLRFAAPYDLEAIDVLIDDLDSPDVFKTNKIKLIERRNLAKEVLAIPIKKVLLEIKPVLKIESPFQIVIAKPAKQQFKIEIERLTNNLWDETKKQLFLMVYSRCGNKKCATATMLGITRRTVSNHLSRENYKDFKLNNNIKITLGDVKENLWERVERELILMVLSRTGANQCKTAKRLGMSIRNLRYKLSNYLLSQSNTSEIL